MNVDDFQQLAATYFLAATPDRYGYDVLDLTSPLLAELPPGDQQVGLSLGRDGTVYTGNRSRLPDGAVVHYAAEYAARPHTNPLDLRECALWKHSAGKAPHPPLDPNAEPATDITFLWRTHHNFGSGGHTVTAYTGPYPDSSVRLGTVDRMWGYDTGRLPRRRRILRPYDHRTGLVTPAWYDPATTRRSGFGKHQDWLGRGPHPT